MDRQSRKLIFVELDRKQRTLLHQIVRAVAISPYSTLFPTINTVSIRYNQILMLSEDALKISPPHSYHNYGKKKAHSNLFCLKISPQVDRKMGTKIALTVSMRPVTRKASEGRFLSTCQLSSRRRTYWKADAMMKAVNIERKRIIEPCAIDLFRYQIDPYVGCEHKCHYCYAQNSVGLDWESETGICPDMDKMLADELSSLEPQTVHLGMNTDPYQPLEKELGQTRRVLQLLKERSFSVCILTKSSLVARDIDLLKEMKGSSAGMSIAFQDDRIRGLFEENTMPTEDRLWALAELKRNGIETYVLVCPVMPYITDVEVLIEKVRPHADTIWIYPLEMKSADDKNWRKIQPIIEQHFPGLSARFREAAFSPGHACWKELRRKLEDIRGRNSIDMKICV
jgi:DNA repair photolyase